MAGNKTHLSSVLRRGRLGHRRHFANVVNCTSRHSGPRGGCLQHPNQSPRCCPRPHTEDTGPQSLSQISLLRSHHDPRPPRKSSVFSDPPKQLGTLGETPASARLEEREAVRQGPGNLHERTVSWHEACVHLPTGRGGRRLWVLEGASWVSGLQRPHGGDSWLSRETDSCLPSLQACQCY